MNNILCCNVGRRGRMMQNIREALHGHGLVIATDNWSVAPALFMADKQYVVSKVTSPNYLNEILDICEKENVKAITTFIDPEIEFLSDNIDAFKSRGILPLCPSPKTASLCFNKYEMFKYMSSHGVRTTLTYNSLESFEIGLQNGDISFPIFIKPVTGSGSVGAQCVNTKEELYVLWNEHKFDYIIQEFMTEGDCDVDVYVDCISHKPVSVFSKRKIETRIGGASKTISFKDQKLFDFVKDVCTVLELNGPCDMDLFTKNGDYYLSEINPRFGGAYLHAYGAGVNFIEYIVNNINGIVNDNHIGEYNEDILMLMYDDVVITKVSDLLRDFHD